MRGKPIDRLTADDVRQLVSDCVAEGPSIEFKKDIPVSDEQQKKGVLTDRSWTNGRRLPDFGRDALAEEIVAFANAAGGCLVLGIDDSKGNPPVAIAINALPDVAGLERRLKDTLNDCIEPRLPYLGVRAVPTEVDGSGVIVIETSPSIAGPHWVRKTRKPTIRREDRCDPLTMTELHDMVLRKSRSLQIAERLMEEERKSFERTFSERLLRMKPDSFHSVRDGGIQAWLAGTDKAALGAQVTLTPHLDIGLPRLETLDGLYPRGDAILLIEGGGKVRTPWLTYYDFANAFAQKILGGVVSVHANDRRAQTIKVMRDGRVSVSFVHARHISECTCHADYLAAAIGVAIGVFDRLRSRSSFPAAAADLTVDIRTFGNVGVGVFEQDGSMASYGQIGPHVAFPQYTIGDTQDFPALFGEVLGDLMNVGNKRAADLKPLEWSDPH